MIFGRNYPHKTLFFFLCLFFRTAFSVAQINAFFNTAIFSTPSGSSFLETSITISGKSLKARPVNGLMQSSAHVSFLLMKDSAIVKAAKYNLNGPTFEKHAQVPGLIDIQRYPVPNGEYDIEVVISDNLDPSTRPLTIRDRVKILFAPGQPALSSIQLLESFKKAEKTGPLTKSGFDLVPYNISYYPGNVNELSFYAEIYNMNLLLGENKNFVCRYFIRPEGKPASGTEAGAFKKLNAAAVNPLIAQLSIKNLPSGNYVLTLEAVDGNNTTHVRETIRFSRENPLVDQQKKLEREEKNSISEYLGNINNADTLKMFVECLWPIANNLDKERVINQSVKKDPEMMKRFIVDFWERRAADTASAVKLWASYYQQVQKVMVMFRCGKRPGYYSERGRVFLQYGPPNQRSEQPNEPNTYPYEIWQYYRLTDGVTGQFFSNRKFVFVNKNLGDDCHELIHSDMRGEINNPRWQFEVTRRNVNGYSDLDNNVPGRASHNQFDEIYKNPR